MRKTKLAGIIISLLGCVIALAMVCGSWLHINALSHLSASGIESDYTLFEISDFLDTIGAFGDENVGIYANILYGGGIAIIILAVITLITTIFFHKASRVFSVFFMLLSALLTIFFTVSIFLINMDISNSTRGFLENILKATSKPYIMAVASLLSVIGVNIKEKPQYIPFVTSGMYPGYNGNYPNQTPQNAPQQNIQFCKNCGSQLKEGTNFCSSCGTPIR